MKRSGLAAPWYLGVLCLLFSALVEAKPVNIPAETQCQVKAQRLCSQPLPKQAQSWSQLRKDAYLDEKEYPEYPELPKNGGRVQWTGLAQNSGVITGVWIDGVDLKSIFVPDEDRNDLVTWYQVWPRQLVKGEMFWLNFHTRRADWNQKSSFYLKVLSDQGIAFEGQVSLDRSDLKITYATQSEDKKTWLIHLKNQGSSKQNLSRFYFNQEDVSEAICAAKTELQPNESVLLTLPLCDEAQEGAAWSLAIESQQGAKAVGTGRILKAFFPIEAWNNTSECPLNDSSPNYRRMRDAAFDTMYMHPGTCSSCGCDALSYLENLPFADANWGALVEDGIMQAIPRLTNTGAIRAISTGDESDGQVYQDEDKGVPKPANKALESAAMWDKYPELPTFNGAKTNRHIGSFAGTSDIQGVDLYVAACAPHISSWGNHPPLRGAFDYLRNARLNHMPSPTWLYAQGLSPAWNQKVLGKEKIVQPEPSEILVQGMSAIAAGAKGLLWFQVNEKAAQALPKSWQAIATINRMIAPLRPWLREGDLATGLVHEGGSIVEMIRSREMLIIPIISLRTDKEVNDLACGAALVSGSFPHWKLKSRGIDFHLDVPSDFSIEEAFEIGPNGVTEPSGMMAIEGRRLVFREVPMDNDHPVRLMVLVKDAALRQRIAAQFR